MTSMPLTLRSPEHAVALVPHLLGFWPQESLIGIWISAGHVALTQRIDVPVGLPVDRQVEFGDWFVDLAQHARPTAALIVAVTSEPAGVAPLARAVGESVRAHGLDLLDVLWTHDNEYGSLLCDDECCPPRGRRVRDRVRNDMAAAFAVQGQAPLASREELVASVERDADAMDALAPMLAAREQEVAVLDAKGYASWRRQQIPIVGRALDAGHNVTPADLVAIAVGVADVQVRDVVMWHLARAEDIRDAVDALTHTVRTVPDGYVAPVATCLAMASWFCGNGALASLAIERALLDDPDYALAQLTDEAVNTGLPPDGWRQALAAMTEADLQLGDLAA